MRSIVWWSVWGLVLAVGAIGLLEFPRSHYFLILSLPLLTGAVAAAIHRLEHEYRHAMEHAKWMGVSAIFLVGAMGFLYFKVHAYGPFSTATKHKALMGVTFGMSVPEVERALGRPLRSQAVEGALQEKAHEWLLEALPLPVEKSGESFSVFGNLFGNRSQLTFYFEKRQLSRVEVQFVPGSKETMADLQKKVVEALGKDYVLKEESTRDGFTRMEFAKEAVETHLVSGTGSDRLATLRLGMEYLPLVEQARPPLTADTNVF